MSGALTMELVTSGYGQLEVVRGVSLTVASGEVTTVIGPNGAGKSTLMATAAGVRELWSGRVLLGGLDVSRTSSARRMRHGLAWVPEGRNVFGDLSVRDNLYLSCYMAGMKRQFPDLESQVVEEFPVLSRKYRHRAGGLSGGEQQILALARALVRRPAVTLLDEPTAGLAPTIVDVLASAIAARAAQGMAWVITEQNIAWLAPLTTAVHVMVGGRLIATGDASLLRDRERIRRLYFGDGPASATDSPITGPPITGPPQRTQQ
jgi:branched-chain amino acid transport system ATP-binding protein